MGGIPHNASLPIPARLNVMKITKTKIKNQSLLTIIGLGAVLITLAACSEKPKAEIKTLETVNAQNAVSDYNAIGTDASKQLAEKAFLSLDQEIKELEIRVESTTGEKRQEAANKLAELKTRESEIRTDFNEAKFNTLIEDIKNSVR